MIRAQRKRQMAARAFAAGSMRMRLLPETSAGRMWTKGSLLISGLALLIVAAARPQYGVYYEQVVQRGVDLFVLLDVSRSMLAEDIAPNRLERAKSDIVDLLERIPRDRVGLIVFAGKPILHVPLTNDHAFFRYMLRDVDTDSAPIGGSLIGDAIRQALAAMEPRGDRDQVIVLITDGDDHDSFPADAAKAAAERGVKIIAVGLGDAHEGARIPVHNPTGGRGFVKDKEGSEVWSKMQEELLKELALTTSGAYVPARTMAYDLGQIYDDHLAGLTRGEIRTEKRRRFREQFQWFIALGLALLFVDWTLVRFRSRAAIALALFIASSFASPALADDTSRQMRDGMNAFDDGDFSTAAELFAAASAVDPDDPRITFNEGCAQAAQQAGEEARDLFYKSALARDPVLSADSHYNLGCLAASEAQRELGEEPLQAGPDQRRSGLALLNRAAGHYRDALRFDTNHADARHNLETIRLWIKQMKALWKKRDREQQRNEQSLLQMLKDLDSRQSDLRSSLMETLQQPASPLRQQRLDELQKQQRGLVDEIEPLKKKISVELSAMGQSGQAGGATAGGGPPVDDVNRAIDILNQWTDELHDSFLRAADNIAADEHTTARQAQRESLETVNQMYVAVAPFPDLLQTALMSQKSLVGQSQNILGIGPGDDAEDKDDVETDTDEHQSIDDASPVPPRPDPDELSWRQHRVGGWAGALESKATQQLPVMQQQMSERRDEQAANAQQQDDPDAAGTDPAEDDQPPDNVSQLEPLIESLQRAVELAPQVQTLALSAAGHVRDSEFEMALPKQEQALKLLEKIAETLPKNDQSRQQNQQQKQDQKEQEQQDESQQQQQQRQNDDQDSQPQDEPEQRDKPEQQDRSQQQDAGQQQKQDEQEPGQHGRKDQPDPPQAKMTPAQAEAILQRVRDRERRHRQVEKQMRRLLEKRVAPERDW